MTNEERKIDENIVRVDHSINPITTYNFATKNQSFIDMHHWLKSKGIVNNKFFLSADKKAYDIWFNQLKADKFDTVMDIPKGLADLQYIEQEMKNNFWFFARDFVEVPIYDGGKLHLNRANLALIFLMMQKVNIAMDMTIWTDRMVTCGSRFIVTMAIWILWNYINDNDYKVILVTNNESYRNCIINDIEDMVDGRRDGYRLPVPSNIDWGEVVIIKQPSAKAINENPDTLCIVMGYSDIEGGNQIISDIDYDIREEPVIIVATPRYAEKDNYILFQTGSVLFKESYYDWNEKMFKSKLIQSHKHFYRINYTYKELGDPFKDIYYVMRNIFASKMSPNYTENMIKNLIMNEWGVKDNVLTKTYGQRLLREDARK